jgi:hypothetical protein
MIHLWGGRSGKSEGGQADPEGSNEKRPGRGPGRFVQLRVHLFGDARYSFFRLSLRSVWA